jgi:hypothetical protein
MARAAPTPAPPARIPERRARREGEENVERGRLGAYIPAVTILRGVVRQGRIVVDEATDLPEGTAVELAVLEAADDFVEESADVLGSIDRGLAQADQGAGSPAADVARRLRLP